MNTLFYSSNMANQWILFSLLFITHELHHVQLGWAIHYNIELLEIFVHIYCVRRGVPNVEIVLVIHTHAEWTNNPWLRDKMSQELAIRIYNVDCTIVKITIANNDMPKCICAYSVWIEWWPLASIGESVLSCFIDHHNFLFSRIGRTDISINVLSNVMWFRI